MQLFLGNEEKVYIIDKAEGNAARINNHPAWGAVYDIKSRQVDLMDIKTNVFCASGMHLPNGSYATFGGNGAITVGGNIGSQKNPDGVSGAFDDVYQDFDGAKSIRILNPCTSSDNFADSKCQWFDDPSVLSMQKKRWYSAAEPLANGTIVMIGGFVNGGYINRNFPNTDPATSGGAAEPTYEFFPSNGQAPTMQFMIKTSGLNSYAHTFMLKSGKMFVQANISTMIWDVDANAETPLPDMPNNVARVYPASGGVAMLPLTPDNNYNPTILFCGGADIADDVWGDYSAPRSDTFWHPASADCQRITPEPEDGSAPAYVADDDMLKGRTMGQFIILPTGKLVIVNGGANGTAGYSDHIGPGNAPTRIYGDMPYGMSLAADPVLKPALYDPSAAKGARWTDAGFQSSDVPRLYHSSAILLPDASVLIAGSNPNVDVNLTTFFPTTYKAEIWYPPYFSASTRPQPSGIPSTLSYGGNGFDVTIPASSYSGSSNTAAANTTAVLVRPGWTTHAMNMGQRMLQLKNSYTVKDDGTIVLHCAQMPPNANIFQPGPALFFVVVNGVPSVGKMVIIGNGQIKAQDLGAESTLPASVKSDKAKGSADGSTTSTNGSTTSSGGGISTGAIIGGVVAAVAVLGILGAIIGICIARRRRAAKRELPSSSYAMTSTGAGGLGSQYAMRADRASDTSAFVPLNHGNDSALVAPYKDDVRAPSESSSMNYEQYAHGGLPSPGPYQQQGFGQQQGGYGGGRY
ncbi:copper radical oxidase variant A [Flagelloscypha sp. PMI_526]|nr:copper radical oxidase variant A [Flagelloscypha sp. PMI_526]